MSRPPAADDFATIRARMVELRRERDGAQPAEGDLQRDPPMRRAGTERWIPSEIGARPGRVRAGPTIHLACDYIERGYAGLRVSWSQQHLESSGATSPMRRIMPGIVTKPSFGPARRLRQLASARCPASRRHVVRLWPRSITAARWSGRSCAWSTTTLPIPQCTPPAARWCEPNLSPRSTSRAGSGREVARNLATHQKKMKAMSKKLWLVLTLAIIVGLGSTTVVCAQLLGNDFFNHQFNLPPLLTTQPPLTTKPPSTTQPPPPPPPTQKQGVLQVGLGRPYQTVSSAVDAANADTDLNNYYDIQVLPGTYTNDFPTVTRPMTIEVDPCCAGQSVILNATVDLPNQKGIILSLGSLTVNGLTFTGAHISNALGGNGAGIRDQNTDPSAKLIIQHSLFTGNQEGILTGDNPDQVVMVNNSSFINNGNPDPGFFQHSLYVNGGTSLSVSNSLFCGQLIGQNVKSRAQVTMVTNNQIYDGATNPNTSQGCDPGSSSLAIDVANGGAATITGNQLIQGPTSQNFKLVDYGEEGLAYSSNSLIVSGNNFVSMGTPAATALYDPNCVPAQLSNNTFTGITTVLDPANCAAP